MAAKKADAPVKDKDKEPKVGLAKPAKTRLETAVRALEDSYGPHIYPDERTPLECVLFALLAAHDPVTNVRKALREVREVFVDWNEARIATVRELEEALIPVRLTDAHAAAKALRGVLQQTFDALYTLDLATLAALGPDKARKAIGTVTRAPVAIRQYMAVAAGVEDAPPLDDAVDRVLMRLGVMEGFDDPTKRRKALAGSFKGEAGLRFHHVVVEHAKKVCTETSPKCTKCPIQAFCDYYEESKREGAPGKAAGPGAAKKARKDDAPASAQAADDAPSKNGSSSHGSKSGAAKAERSASASAKMQAKGGGAAAGAGKKSEAKRSSRSGRRAG